MSARNWEIRSYQGGREVFYLTDLTVRERLFVELLVEGLSTKQIAEQMRVAFHTAETYRANVYRVLGVHSAVELIRKLYTLTPKQGEVG